MHAGNVKDAIAELRNLIESEWNYWSICAIDRSLEPIRTEINALLAQMREEQRIAAKKLLNHLGESIQLLEDLEKAIDQVALAGQISSAKETRSNLQGLYETGNVFLYRSIISSTPAAHESVIRKAVQTFEQAIQECEENFRSAQAISDRQAAERIRPTQEMLDQAKARDREGKLERSRAAALGCSATVVIVISGLVGIIAYGLINASEYSRTHVLENLFPIIVFTAIGVSVGYALLRYLLRPFGRKRKTSALRKEGVRLKAQSDALRKAAEPKNSEARQALRAFEADNQAIESTLRQGIEQLLHRLPANAATAPALPALAAQSRRVP
jgi:hypothetical protein